jgi:succinoglycan biosynthesis transport protein ExoP
MPQYDFQITDYERIFRKRYKIVLFTVICGAVFSVMFARMKVPMYTSVATVKVERNSMIGLGMENIIYDTWDNIETQSTVVTSFPVLLRAAKRISYIPVTFSEDTLPTDEKTLGILESIRSKIRTSTSAGSNIIKITVTSNKREEARDIANNIAFAYKEFSLKQKKAYASKTKDFVRQQLEVCKGELADAEHDIESFEEGQKIPSIDANSNRIIMQSTKLEEELQTLDNAQNVIRLQQMKVKHPLGVKTPERRAKTDSLQGNIDSLSFASSSPMGWVSEFTDQDPGIQQLNSRLLQLQLQHDDVLSYYKKDHPNVRDIENKIKVTSGQMVEQYQKKLADLDTKKQKLMEQKAEIDRQLQLVPMNQMSYGRLVRKLKVREELYTELSKKLQESMIAEAGVVDEVTIMSMATLPANPMNQDIARVIFIGILLGFIFGVIFAVLREMFDTSIGTIEDVERTLKIAVLAVIPHIRGEEQKKKKTKKAMPVSPSEYFKTFLVTHFNPKDPSAEAYRILRTNIGYLSFNKPLQTILVTSAAMQEGKSTTISNLAVAFAQQGKNILLLECNLRRPSLQRCFGIDHNPGVSDILIGKISWRECVMTVTDLALGRFGMEDILKVPGLDKLNFIPYGHRPPNPTELLSSPKMDELLRELREYFDIILVDGPPILPVADSIVLSTKVDGVIMVYKVGKTPRNSLRLGKERLETVHANILGIALNDIRPEITGASYSSYIYRYAKETTKPGAGAKRWYRPFGTKSKVEHS